MARTTLDLGILAHVDAGKTTLTERLLHVAGVIDSIGSVDRGTTQTDTLALERQRGITIRSAVVSFALGETTVNLIDTPGHPDFVAEVERVLQRLRLPTLLFVNKTDRAVADSERVLAAVRERLTPAAAWADDETALTELLAAHDDELLATWVDEGAVPAERLRAALAEQTRRALVCPAFAGSALTGAGIPELAEGIAGLLPAAAGDPEAPLAASVFKIERGEAGEGRLRESTVIHVERPLGRGEAVEVLHADRNPFSATVGLRVEPGPEESGVAVRLEVPTSALPLHVYRSRELFAVELERYVRSALAEGLHGWLVVDCVVTMTRCGYAGTDGPPAARGSSTPHDYEHLTALVLADALAAAGTAVCEPVARAAVEAPAECLGAVLHALAGLGAAVEAPAVGGALATVEAVLPAARLPELRRRLPGLSGSEGVVETAFAGYRPVSGEAPERRRRTPDPLNRSEYLLHLARRV